MLKCGVSEKIKMWMWEIVILCRVIKCLKIVISENKKANKEAVVFASVFANCVWKIFNKVWCVYLFSINIVAHSPEITIDL